ncbi:unnamed protein product [Diabrotica balteata]|uniref:Ionotropic glutamate receptor C-terminal domain-containing protein n=1 Tax=Diabrotica balteata TaxID=107213 RepID=A0A9N9XBA1_DIABA|nr:unnamed protein product [Diabrotica balteata]
MGNQLQLFNQPYRWIIWGRTDHTIFKNLYFRVDSQIYLIEHPKRCCKNDTSDPVYKIKSLYKLSDAHLNVFENNLVEWTPQKGFLKYSTVTFFKQRKNLNHFNLNVSYVITDPDSYNHLEDFRNIHIDAISKLNWIIVGLLLSTLNASSTNIFQSTWGYKEGNSTIYSGMIGDLQSNRAEIGGTALFFTIDRVDVIEYVAPSAPTFMKFIFKAPPLSYVSNVFTLPFDTYVWYCCFALVPIIFIAVFIIVKWEWKDPVFKLKVEETHSNSITPLRPGFFDILVMELGAITQQGSDTEPKSNAGRAAIVFTFIAFMFLYTAYSANIVALLQSTTESIKTLEDLLRSRMGLGVEDIVYAHYYFKTADEPTRKAIYQQKVAPKGQKPNFFTKEEGIARVQKEFFGFHIELSTGYKVIADTFNENEKCSLKEIEFIKLLEPWLSIKKNSAYKEVIKVGLRKILESGLQRRNTNRLYLKKPVCHSKVYITTTWEATDPVFKNSKQHSNAAKLQPAWFDIILMQLGAITQQGAEAEPKSNSGRMVFVFTFISILFLYTAYTANIVALLQSTSDVIKNSEDLVNSGIGLGMRNISFVLRLLATSTDPITKSVYQKVSETGRRSNILELEEGMDRVRKEFFAFQTDPSVAYGIVKKTFQESEKCDLRQANRQNLFRSPFTWILWGHDHYQNMQNMYFRIDSKIFTIHKLKNKNMRSIKSLYKLNDYSIEFTEDLIAEWEHRHGFLWYNYLTYRNRSNLMGMDMKISSTAFFADVNNHLDDFKETHSDAPLKVTTAMLKVITEMVNITPVMAHDSGSNKCSGMIEDLESGLADLPGNNLC